MIYCRSAKLSWIIKLVSSQVQYKDCALCHGNHKMIIQFYLWHYSIDLHPQHHFRYLSLSGQDCTPALHSDLWCNYKASIHLVEIIIIIKKTFNCFFTEVWQVAMLLGDKYVNKDAKQEHTCFCVVVLTQCGQLHLPSGALSSSGSRQTRW